MGDERKAEFRPWYGILVSEETGGVPRDSLSLPRITRYTVDEITRETHFNEVSRDSFYTVYVHYTYNMYTYGVCEEVAQAEDAAPRDVYENGYVCM